MALGLKLGQAEDITVLVHALNDVSVFLPFEPTILPIETYRF